MVKFLIIRVKFKKNLSNKIKIMKKNALFFVMLLSISTIVKAQSCQPFTIQLDSQLVSHPILEFNEFKMCEGDTLTLAAVADFPSNNLYYLQTQSNTKFIWNFESMDPDTAIIVNKHFDQPIIKNFTLRAEDVNGCISTNQIYSKVITSGNPIIRIDSNIIAPLNTTIFLNATIYENSTLLFQPIEISIPPVPIEYLNDDTVFLPDGNGICYNDQITILNFSNNQTLTGVYQLKSIILNMEHSYLEDISIRLTCPSGKVAILKAYTSSVPIMSPGGTVANACSSLGGTLNLGCPIDAPSTNLCYNSPGIGFDYEFRPGSTGCFGSAGGIVESSFIDQCGNPWTAPSLIPSTPNIYTAIVTIPTYYGAYQNLSSLIGCPLNGNWKITICDHVSYDNGFVFRWGIKFDETLQANPNPYNIDVDSVSWTGPNLTTIDPFSAYVYHNTAAIYNYSATVHDQFGCQYVAPFTINTTVSIENFSDEPSSIKVYPNPTNGVVTITNDFEPIKLIQLYSINGLLLYEKSLNEYNQTLDLSLYQSGVYICKVTTSNGEIKQVKIMKK